MRNPEYQFADTSAEAFVSRLVSDYEKSTGTTVQPASPERKFIAWAASILILKRVLMSSPRPCKIYRIGSWGF